MMQIRDLHGLDDYRAVVALEQAIWGYTDLADVVTVPVFIISIKRGGILIGAFDERDRMVGFAFSIVGIKGGRPTQWSHMMGVLPEHRGTGLGTALKLAQRDRAIAAGFDLMEWTFDPLQALNAHLNFARLGVVCDEYVENLYGDSTSALHRGTPTDRFVVEWRLGAPHVERRIARDDPAISIRAAEAKDLPTVNRATDGRERPVPLRGDLTLDEPRIWVEIPTGFTQMLQDAPDLALEWRLTTREIFQSYFRRGYSAIDFEFQHGMGRGRYLLQATGR